MLSKAYLDRVQSQKSFISPPLENSNSIHKQLIASRLASTSLVFSQLALHHEVLRLSRHPWVELQ